MKNYKIKAIFVFAVTVIIISMLASCADHHNGFTNLQYDLQSDNAADDNSENNKSSISGGVISFYNEPVADTELEQSVAKRTLEPDAEQAQQIFDILSTVEWMDEAALDRLAGTFDGEIILNNMDTAVDFGGEPSEKNNCICYFGYQKELYFRYMPNGKSYYIGYYAPLTDEQMQCIKNMKP